jgi:UDP-N-acetylglucosamine 2-epimerase
MFHADTGHGYYTLPPSTDASYPCLTHHYLPSIITELTWLTMKIASIVGARPQFIKAAPLSHRLRLEHSEIIIHTGQHYDQNLSGVFFDELSLPAPDYHLGIGSASPGLQTGQMLAAIEPVLQDTRPDWVIVYGDTNSTLAGALAAAKLGMNIAHVEAGLRSFNRRMPEEINRILTDHVSDLLLCPSEQAVAHLAQEGITRRVHNIGDIMADSLRLSRESGHSSKKILQENGVTPKGYLLATIHRAENTDSPHRLHLIFSALNRLTTPVILPLHPRTRQALHTIQMPIREHIRIIEPVGYLAMIHLEENARLILTDSGGIQKEAYWLGVPCITLRDETEWPETVDAGWNILVGADTSAILQAVSVFTPPLQKPTLYGDGHAADKIVDILNTLEK